MARREGRLPGGRRVWKEWEHPRDDRGRFARKGGAKWAARVVRAVQAGFGDTGAHDPAHSIVGQRELATGHTPGRLPGGGVLDLKKISGDASLRAMLRGAENVKTRDASHLIGQYEVFDGGKYHRIDATGFENGEDYVGWYENGVLRKVARPTITVRKIPGFEPTHAVGRDEHRRMDGWADDARKAPQFRASTNRDRETARAQGILKDREAKLKEATRKARARANRKYPAKEGYDKRWRDEYVEREIWMEQKNLEYAQGVVRDLEANDDEWLDKASGHNGIFEGKIDRSRPLAVYGDMLHFDAYDNASFVALRTLEEGVPAELHQIVAGWMHGHRTYSDQFKDIPAYKGKLGEAGIFVGAKPVSQLRGWGRTKDEKPRGWGDKHTFDDVNGVVDGSFGGLFVGWTDNSKRRGEGKESHTALHEFGHALDFAIGRDGEGSHSDEWAKLHARSVADAGDRMSPYYKQDGHAGPQEMWAEAFMAWSRAMRDRNDGRTPLDRLLRLRFGGALGVRDQAVIDDLNEYFLKITRNAGVQW
ncbi:MAG TPA: hypothetical protein VF516_12215 [Kofleriaceae bacterium]